jgi:hypothetical protein
MVKLPFGIFKSGDITYCFQGSAFYQENNLNDYQYILCEARFTKRRSLYQELWQQKTA